MNRRDFCGTAAALSVYFSLPRVAHAQGQIDQLRIFVGFPAGGANDAIARHIAEGVRPSYARAAIVENRPGLASRFALDAMKRYPSDGSSMVVMPETIVTLIPHVDPSPSTPTLADLVPVTPCAVLRQGFAVGPMVPASVKTMRDFLAWAKANPTLANYGTPGPNSPQRFLMQELLREAGITLNHIPYKGSMPGIVDLLGGQIATFVSPIGDSMPHIKEGRLRLLGVASGNRSKLLPGVPTLAEQGFTDKIGDEFSVVVMAKGTPPEIVEAAAKAITQVLTKPTVVQSLAGLGMEPHTSSPVGYAQLLRENHKLWGERVKASGFKPEA
jgi:tripartite-type tricarboxylate transporter receptor subunit TctC